jgi:hypothetical protein
VTAQGPIFIGGLDRSGKTRLRMALQAHPSLVMARRLNLWTGVFGRYGDLTDDLNARRCVDALLSSPQIVGQLAEPGRLADRLMSGPRTYASLIEEIGSQLMERSGRPRWGLQEALLERHADAIFDTYPKATIIHMIRDPRSRFLGMAGTPSRRGGIATATAAWIESIDLAERNERRYAEHYLVVRNEDLAERPEETLRRICDRVGFSCTPAMIDAARPTPAESLGAGPVRMLRARQVAFIQGRAGRQLASRGYAAAPVRLTLRELLRYRLIDVPVNLATTLAWKLRERKGTLVIEGGA